MKFESIKKKVAEMLKGNEHETIIQYVFNVVIEDQSLHQFPFYKANWSKKWSEEETIAIIEKIGIVKFLSTLLNNTGGGAWYNMIQTMLAIVSKEKKKVPNGCLHLDLFLIENHIPFNYTSLHVSPGISGFLYEIHSYSGWYIIAKSENSVLVYQKKTDKYFNVKIDRFSNYFDITETFELDEADVLLENGDICNEVKMYLEK